MVLIKEERGGLGRGGRGEKVWRSRNNPQIYESRIKINAKKFELSVKWEIFKK